MDGSRGGAPIRGPDPVSGTDKDPEDRWFRIGRRGVEHWVTPPQDGTGHGLLPCAPVSQRTRRPTAELIEDELLRAQRLAAQHPPPAWFTERPGWLDGVITALRDALRDGR